MCGSMSGKMAGCAVYGKAKRKNGRMTPTGEKTQYLRYYFNDAPIQYMSV